jgi:hypothetical protein
MAAALYGPTDFNCGRWKSRRRSRLGKRCAFSTFPPPDDDYEFFISPTNKPPALVAAFDSNIAVPPGGYDVSRLYHFVGAFDRRAPLS